jgi:hypothetical protein
MNIHQATLIDKRNYCHEIDFNVKSSSFKIVDPFSDIKVVITQNDRWDNAKTNPKPLFIKDDELVYDDDRNNVFFAGTEYRNFDIKVLGFILFTLIK